MRDRGDELAMYNRSIKNPGNPAPFPRALPVPITNASVSQSIPAVRSLPVTIPGIASLVRAPPPPPPPPATDKVTADAY